uniref:Uncharacterized protein n=1 Tax=Nothoprocta perdicaria TaxID=30464 RepID=A0A8C6ZVS8_NOTPE
MLAALGAGQADTGRTGSPGHLQVAHARAESGGSLGIGGEDTRPGAPARGRCPGGDDVRRRAGDTRCGAQPSRCTRWCCSRLEGCAKPLSLDCWLKRLPHAAHAYGRSPVCERWCLLRSEGLVKVLAQAPHGLTPVCVRWWVLRCVRRLKLFPHSAHT